MDAPNISHIQLYNERKVQSFLTRPHIMALPFYNMQDSHILYQTEISRLKVKECMVIFVKFFVATY